MTAKIIDGNAVAREIRGECRERVLRVVAQAGSPPGLAVLLVGSDPASRLYVKNKIRACADVGIQSFRHDYPADVKQDAVIEKIEELNGDPSVSPLSSDHGSFAIFKRRWRKPLAAILGCVPGGLIDPENLERHKRERERGLWVWEWWSYENELKWWQIEAEVKANMDPWARKALGWK
jgi:hypothetical protein